MPARVEVNVDEAVLEQVIEELMLSNPPSLTLNGNSEVPAEGNSGRFTRVRGLYDPANNHVTIASQGESYEREGLSVLTSHIRFTLLHELRHAWQREHWTEEEQRRAAAGPYELRREEIDANTWADYASPKYRGLVRVKRHQVGRSGFSRLGDAEKRVASIQPGGNR